MSFSFQRSQSSYPVSRGLKSRNIWYSSTWKHLLCHLFSFLLLSCWMWITQWPCHMAGMAANTATKWYYKSQAHAGCSGNETRHLCRILLNLPAYNSHAILCQYLPLVWKTLANHFLLALHDCLRLLNRPVRNWWQNHSRLHISDTERKAQEMHKWKQQTNSSITKAGRGKKYNPLFGCL